MVVFVGDDDVSERDDEMELEDTEDMAVFSLLSCEDDCRRPNSLKLLDERAFTC